MADNMFVEPSVNIGGKRKYTVIVSIVAHTLVIAAAAIVPLVATDSVVLPARFAMIAFPTQPPLPPSPPPPRVASREAPSIAKPAVLVEAPQGIAPESPIPATTDPFAGLEYSAGLVPGGDYSAPPAPPPPAPDPPRAPMPVGGDIKPPTKIDDAAPIYPAIARAAGVQGMVIISATIGPDGRVHDARVIRSIPLLDAAALEAVRKWQYTPTLLNGTPIAIVMTVTVNFRLR